MDLLRRERAARAGAPRAFVFGLGYADDPRGLDPLQGAVPEARAVAAAVGVEPVLDADATRGAVLGALRRGQWIHIACHGEHDVVAPSLQSLRLAPSADDDGRLASVDLHALDLSGVEILSLGACETALGRFDAGDNLRGLTASALAAGAACVVGTLWPASDAAAEVFFTTLFREVASGASRFDAFRQAQVAARAAFPEYRDWAPFYLSGVA
jgi:CHAT domain-containing protein